ncbi:MAG: exodeoxyribonuclease V subunit alpha, partial [Pseudoxanthomonas sp.]
MSLLEQLSGGGALRVIDHALAQSLRKLDPATPDQVLAAAALASLAVGQGHAAFDPARPQLLFDGPIDWPEAGQWKQALADSRWIHCAAADAPASTATPLVLENGLLYLRRYREYEFRLAMRLRQMATQVADAGDTQSLAPLFAQLFPEARHGEDRQAQAAATALRRSLLLVTGGPGTGKTTTIARLLLLLMAQAAHAGRVLPRVALAAPTGRAAERMAESLRSAVATLRALPGVDAALCDALPTQASTLHRLLGSIPDSPRFRFDADNPLPFDLVVVDEASMVDLPLMCKLVEAVPPGARLVLLGDPDQLPSVEAGDVLSAILGAAGAGDTVGTLDAAALQPLLGRAINGDAEVDRRAFGGRRVHLRQGYRQAAGFALAPLAEAVRSGDAGAALAMLRGEKLEGVHFHEGVLDPLERHRERLLGHWRALGEAVDPAEALQQAGRLRLLTAVREGAQGARALNARIEALLADGGRSTARGGAPGYFHGRLLQVTENSYRHRLFNGDIGICLRDGAGALVAWFAGEGEDQPRPFHPATLPAHESAFAMTVHKAQGSEFTEVWLQLPRNDSRVLSRELLYTGLTRARSALHLAGSEAVIRAALSRHASRVSGLGWRLLT